MAKGGKASRLGCLLAACAILASCTTNTAEATPAFDGEHQTAIIASSDEVNTAHVLSAGMTHAIQKGYYSDDAVYHTNDPIPAKELCYAVLAVSRTTLDAESLQSRLDYLHKLYVRCGLLPDSDVITNQDAVRFIDRMWKLNTDTDFDLAIQTDDSTEVDHLNALYDAAGLGLISNDQTFVTSDTITYGTLADILARQDGAIARTNIQPQSDAKAAQNGSTELYGAISELYSSEETLHFFENVALKSEYAQTGAGSGSYHNLVRWTKNNIAYSIEGNASETIKHAIGEAISELNAIPGVPNLIYSESEGDLVIHVGTDTAKQLLSRYGATGFCSLSYDNTTGHIVKGNVYTYEHYASETKMKHVMLEEITQTLGLINDCEDFTDSIFYDGANDITSLSELDKLAIEMLYSDAVKPNMTAENCRIELAEWLTEYVYKN